MLDSKKDDFQTIIFFNEDIRLDKAHKKIKEIEYYDLNTTSREVVMKASLVLYIDRDTLQTKILKNRWGNNGVVAK